ncbi:MAG: HNH endonuclease [Steroidobacteraceae bacterium]
MKKERWLPVVGYEGLYEVSSEGPVRGLDRLIGHPKGGMRLWRGKLLKATVRPDGYREVSLCRDGVRTVRTAHSVVAEAFHGPCPPRHEVAHDNGRRGDNRASNLLWKTRKDNHADKIRHGTTNRGERQGLAKLTDSKVRQARRWSEQGRTHEAIAAALGVTRRTAGRAITGASWGHV